MSKEIDFEELIHDLEGVCFSEYGSQRDKVKNRDEQ